MCNHLQQRKSEPSALHHRLCWAKTVCCVSRRTVKAPSTYLIVIKIAQIYTHLRDPQWYHLNWRSPVANQMSGTRSSNVCFIFHLLYLNHPGEELSEDQEQTKQPSTRETHLKRLYTDNLFVPPHSEGDSSIYSTDSITLPPPLTGPS